MILCISVVSIAVSPLSFIMLSICVFSFFFNKFILFIYLWLSWVFVAAFRLSLVAVRGLCIAVASLVAEHGL